MDSYNSGTFLKIDLRYLIKLLVEMTKISVIYICIIIFFTNRFEWQKAKVLVSKLKCDPYEYVSLDERLEKLENASSPMEDRIDQINNSLVEV